MLQKTSPTRWLLGSALALALTLGCSEESREAQLQAANEVVSEAAQTVERARELLEERELGVAEAETARDEALAELRELESQLNEAEAAVGLHATDDVLFRTVQKQLLEDPELAEVAIAASVRDGIVTLTGAVPDAALRDHAVEVTAQVAGVSGVESQIRVPISAAPQPAQD